VGRPVRRGRWAVAAAALALAATLLPGRPPRADASAGVPPERRVVVFADSVGLGARNAIPQAFPDGWSVHVDGKPARFVEQMLSQYVLPDMALHPDWFGDHVVIAAGYNAPYWDWDRFDRSIDSMVNALTDAGVKHVYWVTLRDVSRTNTPRGGWFQIDLYGFYFPIVNAHLEAALERHPNLTLIDWRAVSGTLGLTYDAIHLNPTGAARYSALLRDTVMATATTVPDGGVATVAVPDAAGAGAAFVNLTTTDPRTAGFLSVGAAGCDTATVSVHNYWRGLTAAHAAIVPLAPDGTLCVRSRAAANLVVDTSGMFPAGGGFTALNPQRWVDTRTTGAMLDAGATLRLDVADLALPAGSTAADVSALALTVTATDATAPGWLRVVPCGASADTSNVNYLDGFPVPNLVVATPDADGYVCVDTLSATHVIVDAFGTFDAEADVRSEARRVFDSRAAGGPVAAGSVTRVELGEPVPGAVLNLTAVGAQAPGYLTVFACGEPPPTASNLNVPGPAAVSNTAIVAPADDGSVCVFTLSATDLIVDLQATIGPAFEGRPPVRVLDTRAA